MKIGDYILYKNNITDTIQTELGKVKSFADDGDPFVVYHCNNDWDNYKNYTGEKTPKEKCKVINQ